MISGSCRLRSALFMLSVAADPAGWSFCDRKKSGSSRFIVSSWGGRELPVFSPVISSSSSAGEDDSRSSSIDTIDDTRLSSSAASCDANAERKRGPSAVSTRFHLRTIASRLR